MYFSVEIKSKNRFSDCFFLINRHVVVNKFEIFCDHSTSNSLSIGICNIEIRALVAEKFDFLSKETPFYLDPILFFSFTWVTIFAKYGVSNLFTTTRQFKKKFTERKGGVHSQTDDFGCLFSNFLTSAHKIAEYGF